MVDADEIKRRVTLRSVMERDGIVIRRSGSAHVACCPVHQERTPSFHLHEKEGGDWFKCFGCGISGDIFEYMKVAHGLEFRDAVTSLAGMAGLSADAMPAPLPKREEAPEDKPPEPMEPREWLLWERAAAEVYTDREELARWSSWRGIRIEVIEWASRRVLCGRIIYRHEWREAFLIRRVAADGSTMEDMGWHVRLGPGTQGNDGDKASWRYVPPGIGAWPFVVLPSAGIEAAKYVFICEGQWDALALIDLMGWDAKWPEQVAVFGMRGATSWKRVLDYRLRNDATAFLIADRDAAGAGWFQKGKDASFSEQLEGRVRFVYGFWPAIHGAKDLNDALKGMDARAREIFRWAMRKKIARKRGVSGPRKVTFFAWARRQKEREDAVGDFARNICIKGTLTPKGRAKRGVWLRYMRPFQDFLEGFKLAWGEWEALG